jgi:hypothetical protein
MAGFHTLNYNESVRRFRTTGLSVVLSAFILALSATTPNAAIALDPCPNTNAFTGISSLTVWLRADCVNGVDNDPADNSTVSTWTDVSSNGNNATASGSPTFQSDSGNLINSNPVISFSGSTTFSSVDIRAGTRPNITIVAVYKPRGTGNREGVWGIDDGGWDRFFLARWVGNDGLISVGNSSNVTNSGVIGTPTLITTVMRYNVSNGTTVYRNGDLAATTTDNASPTSAYANMLIGSGGNGLNFTGDIAELIVFSQALSTSDLITVNGYLNNKYSLNIASGNLPIPATAPTFNSFALAGSVLTATYRSVITVNINVSQSSKVTFLANGKTIAGCKNKATTGSGSSHAVSCSWRPTNRGSITLSAVAVGTAGGLSGTPSRTLSIAVNNRAGRR